MIGYIYKTIDLTNGLIYVGKRQKSYFDKNYFGSGKHFKNAFKAHGKENFICDLIDRADTIDELLAKEVYWIEKLDARNPEVGYNLVKGGYKGRAGLIKLVKNNKVVFIYKEYLKQYLADDWQQLVPVIISEVSWPDYQKAWRERHKDAIAKQAARYYKEHKEEIKIKRKQRQITDHEHYLQKARERNKRYYQNNKEKEKLRSKSKSTKQQRTARHKAWVEKNKDRQKAYSHQYYLKTKQK